MPSHLSPRTSPLHRPFSQPSSYQGHSNASQPIPIKSRYSPPFSPSPSPSPPAHGYSQQDNVLRSSSAPVSIPRPSNPMRPNSRLPMADPYHQNRGLLPPPSPQSKPAEVMLNRVASCNPRLWHGAQVHSNLHFNSNTFLSLPIALLLISSSHSFHYHQGTHVFMFVSSKSIPKSNPVG
jgi:autophagy-related protein 13